MFNPTEAVLTATDKKFLQNWNQVAKPLSAYCRNQHADIETADLISAVKIVLYHRFKRGEITKFNLGYSKLTVKSCARDIRREEGRGPKTKKKLTPQEIKKIEAAERAEAEANAGWGQRWELHTATTVSIEDIADVAIEGWDPAAGIDTRNKIAKMIDRCADARCRAAIIEIIDTDDEHTSVCKKHHIKLPTFKKYCIRALSGPQQFDIIGWAA